jgi:hypothetical protein
MRPVPLVLIAEVFEDVGARLQQVRHVDRERLRVVDRIVECECEIEMPDIAVKVNRSRLTSRSDEE